MVQTSNIAKFLQTTENIVAILADALYSSSWFVGYIPNEMKPLREKAEQTGMATDQWCREDYWAYILEQGGYICLDDTEEEQTYQLTLEKMSKGWEMLSEQHPKVTARIIEGDYDFYDVDAVLQYAVFGEWVYG